MSRMADYLQTVTSLQHVLQDLEVHLDRTRAETDNEWRIRYDIHLKYKRALEMRTHRLIERIRLNREALRDGGLEYHRFYRLKSEHALYRMVNDLEKIRKEKYLEYEKKEELLDKEAEILKAERNRRALLAEELEAIKLTTTEIVARDPVEIPQSVSARRLLKQKLDNVVDTVLSPDRRPSRDRRRRRQSSTESFNDDLNRT